MRQVILNLEESRIREVANAGMGRADVLAFWFGESDEVTPDFIRQAAIDSLNKGETFYSHNLGLLELREAISECQRVIALLENKSLRETVASVKGLPVGPRSYQRITRLIDSPDGKINDIAGLITEDPSLSASVLRFVNSAFFGLG
eukprot:gene29745-51780_t